MVTTMAVKIGGIESETAVRDRALTTTTGVMSIYLATIPVPRDAEVVGLWAREVERQGLMVLFRKGYGLLKEVFDLRQIDVSFGSWVANSVSGQAQTRPEADDARRMELIATKTKNGSWIGYAEFLEERAYRINEHVSNDFALWLVRKVSAERDVVDHADLYQEAHLFVERVILNLMHTGKLTNGMDYQTVRKIVKEARGNAAWHARGMRRYRTFLKTIPARFLPHLEPGRALARTLNSFWEAIDDLRKGKRSASFLTSFLSAHMGILSPGFREKLEREG